MDIEIHSENEVHNENEVHYRKYQEIPRDTSPAFLTRFFANALALGASAYLIDGLQIDSIVYLLISSLIFTLLNAFVKPILFVLTLPLTIITLGLFYPIVNVIILNIVDFFMGSGFIITGIFSAILVSIVVAIVNYAVTNLFVSKKRDNDTFEIIVK